MPMKPLSGVRISWLMLVRKTDLARLADSAWSLACTSSSSAFLRKVMSVNMANDPAKAPWPSVKAVAETMVQSSPPSLRRKRRSYTPPVPSCRLPISRSCSLMSSGKKNSSTLRPIISSGAQPSIVAMFLLTKVVLCSASMDQMPSLAVSTKRR